VTYQCDDQHTIDGHNHGSTSWSTACTQAGAYTSMEAFNCQKVKYNVQGQIRDATNNRALANAEVTLRVVGTDIVERVTTNSQGLYAASIPHGKVQLNVTRDGYISDGKSLGVVDRNIPPNDIGDLPMSPTLPADGWRVVLTWAENPRDLDSHLYFCNSRSCHLYYSRKRVHGSNSVMATLDVDDTRSFGPETTTLKHVSQNCQGQGCKFIFKVDNYTGRKKLTAASEAVVKVFHGNSLVATFSVASPNQQFSGSRDRAWVVFSLDAKTGEVSACTNPECS